MFLSTCKSCCCRWKTRKKAKNQPTNQTNKKNTAPKIVTNVYSPVRIIGQTRKKFQTFFPSSHSDVSGVASWSPRDGGPKAGMRNAEGACSMWMLVWPQMDLEWLVPSPWAHQSLDIGWPSSRKSKRTALKCNGTSVLQEISKHPGLHVSLGLRISTLAPFLIWPQLWIIVPLAVWFCRSSDESWDSRVREKK